MLAKILFIMECQVVSGTRNAKRVIAKNTKGTVFFCQTINLGTVLDDLCLHALFSYILELKVKDELNENEAKWFWFYSF